MTRLAASVLVRAQQRLQASAGTSATRQALTAAAYCSAIRTPRLATASTFSTASSSTAVAASETLLRDAARLRKRRSHATPKDDVVSASTRTSNSTATLSSEELLAALGLEANKSNAYYNKHMRAALDRRDIDTAAAIVAALHAPPANDSSSSATPSTPAAVIWTQHYDALLFEWSQRGDVTRTLALLNAMIARNRVSTRSFHTALVACSKARKLQAAKTVLAQMRAADKTPGPFAYANAINCCARRDGDVAAAEQLWHDMLADGVEPSIEVVNCLARVYSRAQGRSLATLSLVQDALHVYDLTPDAITHATLVQALLHDEEIDDAVRYLHDVQTTYTRAPRVELSVLHAVLDACRQLEDWTNAASVQQLIATYDRSDAVTTQLLALCDARDAAAPPIAWSFEPPFMAISTRVKRREQRKHDAQRPEQLQRAFHEIIAALQASNSQHQSCDNGAAAAAIDASAILERVSSRKQWERMLTASRIEDVTTFVRLCDDAELELSVELRNLYLHALATQPAAGLTSESLDTALAVLHDMIERDEADATTFNNVLALCSRLGCLETAEHVLETMKQQQHKRVGLSTFSYNAVLNCCACERNVARAEELWSELRAQGLRPDCVTLNTMLKTFASTTELASQRYAQQRTGSALASSAATQSPSYASRALKLFQQSTRQLRIEASAATYFSLFRTFVQETDRIASGNADGSAEDEDIEDEDDEARERRHRQITALVTRICTTAPVERLDTAVFNAALDYFQRCGDTTAAFDVFNAMTARGFEPTDLTLRLLFAACSRTEQKDIGLKFLHYLMDDHAYHPTLDVLNGAIELCATSSAPHEALELFYGIQSSSALEPNEATFVHLVHAFARQGDVAQALEYTHALEQQLGVTSLDAYNRVLQACAVKRAPMQALDVLEHMREHARVAPDAISYNMVLKAFAKGTRRVATGGADADALDAAEEDEEDSLDRVEDIKEDDEDLDDSVDDTDDEDARELKREDVRQVLMDLLAAMRRDGIAVTSITYKRLIAACAVRSDTTGVFAFADDLLQSQTRESSSLLLASDSSLANYLRACRRTGDLARTHALMDALQQWHSAHNARVSPHVVLQLLQTLDALGAWRDAVRVLRDLDCAYGVEPNAVFFTRVMRMCNAAGEFHIADQIFETMQHAAAYRSVAPSSESYIEAIFAAEQREQWVRATNLFVDMKNACARDEITPAQLQRIALGRYSEGRQRL